MVRRRVVIIIMLQSLVENAIGGKLPLYGNENKTNMHYQSGISTKIKVSDELLSRRPSVHNANDSIIFDDMRISSIYNDVTKTPKIVFDIFVLTAKNSITRKTFAVLRSIDETWRWSHWAHRKAVCRVNAAVWLKIVVDEILYVQLEAVQPDWWFLNLSEKHIISTFHGAVDKMSSYGWKKYHATKIIKTPRRRVNESNFSNDTRIGSFIISLLACVPSTTMIKTSFLIRWRIKKIPSYECLKKCVT